MIGKLCRKLVNVVGLDQAVIWGLVTRTWYAVAGMVTALVIAHSFSPELQGFHYTFLSLLGLQVFVELGLSGVIITFASHEWARLSLDQSGAITGDHRALSRLSSLAKLALRWFGVAGLLLSCGLTVMGYYFFSTSQSATHVNWLLPWITLSMLTGVNLVILPIWALLQGCDQVAEVNFFRFVEGFLSSILLWSAMLLGAGLWASPIALFTTLVCAVLYLVYRYREFLATIIRKTGSARIGWRKEILPLQWRIAVTWMSGYFMFFLFTPALFHFHGPVVAGQMGMTWTVIIGIRGFAGTWIQSKIPQFGMLVADGRYAELDRSAGKAGLIAFGIACAGGLTLLVAVSIMDLYAMEFRDRLLPLGPIAILTAAEALHQISMAQSSYLRAFKREPFLAIGVTNGLIVGVSTIICAKYYGATGIAVAYISSIILALVWGSRIFFRCRKHWVTSV